MFIGHYAAALFLASKRNAPRLGTLFVAAQLIDIAFFCFVTMGIEHMRFVPGITAMNPMDLYDMPYTHSLLGTLVWALAFGGLIAVVSQPSVRRTAGIIAAMAVVSHWFLDLLVHRPDLSLYDHHVMMGLGLWNHPASTMILELGLLLFGFWTYLRASRPIGPNGRRAPWIMLFVLLVFQAINWFGPPPTTVIPSALLALFAYAVLALLAAWMGDKRRMM